MSLGELACTYATLILHDEDIAITSDKIAALVKSANVTVESYWPSLFAKLAEKRNVGDLVMNIGAWWWCCCCSCCCFFFCSCRCICRCSCCRGEEGSSRE
ncbi:hypothetical protein OIU84_002110 [Salix udensis]|uniref:60S acidic ribosomal protein P1 n=1 Tax=Salix udensis TaxID=889485 RepID=A0AAD6K8A4_9ROSI|nr:hypothetical protein OIU84_002110 [Salix udensis]